RIPPPTMTPARAIGLPRACCWASSPGAVPLRVLPGQMPDLQSTDPDRHRCRVIGIVVFGYEHGVDVLAHALFPRLGSCQIPQVVLVKGFPAYLQTLVAVQQHNLRIVAHPARPLISLAARRLATLDLLTATSATPENPHLCCLLPNSARHESRTLNVLI